ncbi:hypothetical protein ABPG72_007362 [Tetrahymena utriculariae]
MIHIFRRNQQAFIYLNKQISYFSTTTKTITKDPVVFDYSEISNKNLDLSDRIKEAYGPQGIGLCLVKNVPNYPKLRRDLLPLAYQLATLPQNKLQKLVKPEYFHCVGWSHGVEQFNGKYDVSKGSFYGFPLDDRPVKDLTPQQKEQGGFIVENVWPKDDLPQLEGAFKSFGTLMISTGTLLAYHIDKYVHAVDSSYKVGTLENIISKGNGHLARLLHYFPSDDAKTATDDWCGWHNDHGALTGLASALYIDKDGKNLDNFFDVEGGLYAKNRFAEQQRLKIPQDYLAFQIGETAQILSGGIVEATPHCVVRGPKTIGTGISRNTYACFMQPNWDYVLTPPMKNKIQIKAAYGVPSLDKRWSEGLNFAQFGLNTLKAYS